MRACVHLRDLVGVVALLISVGMSGHTGGCDCAQCHERRCCGVAVLVGAVMVSNML